MTALTNVPAKMVFREACEIKITSVIGDFIPVTLVTNVLDNFYDGSQRIIVISAI